MAIDANIALGVKPIQFESPVNQLSNVLQLQGAQQANQLNGLKMQQAQQDMADDQAYRRATIASGGDQTKLAQLLLDGGQHKAYQGLIKFQQDAAKTKADTDLATAHAGDFQQKALAGRLNMANSFITQVKTPADAAAYVNGFYSDPVLGPMATNLASKEQALASIPTDPAGMSRWIAEHSNLDPQKFLELTAPKVDYKNNGKTLIPVQTNSLAPGYTAPQPIQMTTTPGEDLTDNRTRSEGALNRGVQIRGQNLTDARSRETAAQSLGKPIEVTGPDGNPMLVQQDASGKLTPVAGYGPKGGATKALTGEQGKATTFSARMQDAEAVINKLEQNGISGSDFKTIAASSPYTNFMASPEGQQYRQAQENWVTANLRQESGAAIGKDEMAKDVRKFFPAVGDSQAVKEQKATARRVAMEGMTTQAGPGATSIPGMLTRSGSSASTPAVSGNSVQTPDGQTHTFPNAAAAAQFKKAAGL